MSLVHSPKKTRSGVQHGDTSEEESENQNRLACVKESLIRKIGLSEDDLLPNSICSVCLSRLEEAYKLRELSQTSQEALYDMVFKAEKADIVPEEEENATEYDDEIYEVEYLEEPDAPLMIEAHETEIKIEESEIVEPEQNKLSCCGCQAVFDTEMQLHVHLPNRVEHNEKYPVECGGCYRRFKSNSGLNSHLRRASQRKRYACSKCNVTRRTLKELLQHEMGHTGKDAFPCCGCRKRYESKELLEKHSLEEHSSRPKTYYKDEEDITRPFECKICYRKYKSARDLRAHQRFVYYEKIHTCEICGKSFPQQKSLVLHIASHKTEAEFPCPICDKKYKHKAKVRSCVVRHERPRQHKCKICNVIFSRASNLYSHMISHSDERRYKCDICGTTFKRSFHLRKHMYSHTTEMRYGCKYCSTRFSSTAALYKHEVRHTGLLPYECDICNKKLATRQVFIKHYEAHMDESKKVFTCELCPVKYSQSHFLSNHIKYQHRIEPQEKQWNAKFNRKGSKKKGGYRVRGRIYVDSAVQDEEMVILPDEEQQLEYMEDSSD
ncbi:AAEL010635-PA [Aedes aegypti]|uniref:AAEL010635-PA n=1 Tax=Aedes aegypti TaxID=7159 RepID=Q16SC1_AEDAE|nr:AAEL010635-PA [Aedes aegypti]